MGMQERAVEAQGCKFTTFFFFSLFLFRFLLIPTLWKSHYIGPINKRKKERVHLVEFFSFPKLYLLGKIAGLLTFDSVNYDATCLPFGFFFFFNIFDFSLLTLFTRDCGIMVIFRNS